MMEGNVEIGANVDPGDEDVEGDKTAKKKVTPYVKFMPFKYDPEKGCRPEDFLSPTDQYVRRFYARESFKKTKENEKAWPYADDVVKPQLRAVLQVPGEKAGTFSKEPKIVKTYSELKSFFESTEERKSV